MSISHLPRVSSLSLPAAARVAFETLPCIAAVLDEQGAVVPMFYASFFNVKPVDPTPEAF